MFPVFVLEEKIGVICTSASLYMWIPLVFGEKSLVIFAYHPVVGEMIGTKALWVLFDQGGAVPNGYRTDKKVVWPQRDLTQRA